MGTTPVNHVLSGDSADEASATSVLGMFADQLVPAVVPADALPPLAGL